MLILLIYYEKKERGKSNIIMTNNFKLFTFD